ncbi:MAG: GGDEF domain-containing protein [Candidatus Micrarchaeaceae archaeon]
MVIKREKNEVKLSIPLLSRIRKICIKENPNNAKLPIDKMLEVVVKIAEQSNIDTFTNLYNKKQFEEDLIKQISITDRSDSFFSLMILDLDSFKKINDSFGHYYGDIAIKVTAESINKSIRKYDNAYRIGGDEFAIILPKTSKEQVSVIISRIKINVTKNISIAFANKGKVLNDQEISIGVYTYLGHSGFFDQEKIKQKAIEIFNKADKALYEDKVNKVNATTKRQAYKSNNQK